MARQLDECSDVGSRLGNARIAVLGSGPEKRTTGETAKLSGDVALAAKVGATMRTLGLCKD